MVDLVSAAKKGEIHFLKVLRTKGNEWSQEVCFAASRFGHYDCLKFALLDGCPVDGVACQLAAFGGHLNCLRLLHYIGCPWDSRTCAAAADKYALDCLEFAYNNDCPWDSTTTMNALKHGYLEILIFANKRGCPIVLDEYSLKTNIVWTNDGKTFFQRFLCTCYALKYGKYDRIKTTWKCWDSDDEDMLIKARLTNKAVKTIEDAYIQYTTHHKHGIQLHHS